MKARERQATVTTGVLHEKVEDIKRQLENQERAMADFKPTLARERHDNTEKNAETSALDALGRGHSGGGCSRSRA